MLRSFWEYSFPLRGKVPIDDYPDLSLEITYLGYTQITGRLHEKDFDYPLGKSAKKLFNLDIGKHLVTHQGVITRPEEDPNHLRVTICDEAGTGISVMISRAEIEKYVDDEF